MQPNNPGILVGPGLRVSAGLSGAGKSHSNQVGILTHVRQGIQCVVVDRLREWENAPPDILEVSGIAKSFDVLRQALEAGEIGLGILQPDFAQLEAETDAVCEWAGADISVLRGVGLPEAHRALPKSWQSIPENIKNVVTEWRHHNVAMWLDTQRFAMLNADVVELAREVRLFAMHGNNDFKALKAMAGGSGNELIAAVQQCAERLDADDPGWHVHLRARRTGPYEITKL